MVDVVAFLNLVRRRLPRLPRLPRLHPLPPPAVSGQMHVPRNVNHALHAERIDGGFNQWLAVWLTNHVGTMQAAYVFTGIGTGSIVGVLTNNVLLALILGSISSYLIQLVLLPVIMVGQNVLNRHAELMAEEQYATTRKVYADVEVLQRDITEALTLLRQLYALQATPDATRALRTLKAAQKKGATS